MSGNDVLPAARARYPHRARPVGFYPLPATRVPVGGFAADYRPVQTPRPRRGLLYMHVPFCRQRCAFCRFYPGPFRDAAADTFVDAVLREADAWAALRAADPRAGPIEGVFFGGGSPSALSMDQRSRVLDGLRGAFDVAPGVEITTEWYPKDGDVVALAAARAAGVTRISLGIQTWNATTAEAMGAWHTADEADAALAAVRAAGFDNVNIDLMLNVPGQRLEDAAVDVGRALAWHPGMVSLNPLELAAGSPLALRAARQDFTESDADKLSWLDELRRLLFEHGFEHQRARNFFRPGHRHEYNARTHGIDYDIVPMGPGAYGFVGGWALVNTIDIGAWHEATRTAGLSVAGLTAPADDELRRSFGITSMIELGIDPRAYAEQFGTDLLEDFPFLSELLEQGIVHPEGDRLVLDQEAAIHADDVCAEFSSTRQSQLFARHLRVGRSKTASQYFPIEELSGTRGRSVPVDD
jgi:oxygen-independent coproporphyrinogen-3 oxidase